ncbi:uncharacterized protein BP5553_00970 [Venustampulla echinocandica]|uniref:Uncharacterized protein n=1 Tax=Venustampulla echinocandica TaxID=2656787 RepID=A0A370TZN5_9HELO|nr:uncharacterized protein BP5553_00970 [Venustampulla echinocandica]RDL40991.1 hypothetical protein BP5553_00970 [Venustampulla echinocandica]
MNSTNGTAVCIIEANPDVSGTGIRVSIYALALGGRILQFLISQIARPEDCREFRSAVDSALGVQGLALLCTAIYQTFRHQLTLFHAICVIHLLALLGISVVSQGQYQGLGPRRVFTIIAITVISGAAFVAFNAYVWATAPTFGSQPDCNSSTVYVVFGVSIPATGPVFRWLIIATLSIIPVGFLIGLTCAAPCIGLLCYLKRKHDLGPMSTWETTPNPSQVENPRVSQWVGMLSMVGFSIYAVVSLEQTISRNNIGEQEREWTFGQILPVFVLLGVVNELTNMFLAHLDRKAAGVATAGRSGNRGSGDSAREGTELISSA